MPEYDFPVDARLNQDGQFSVLVVDGESAHLLNPGTRQTKQLGYRDQETAMILALNESQPDKVSKGGSEVPSNWGLVNTTTGQTGAMTRANLAYELASLPGPENLVIEVSDYDFTGTFDEYEGAEDYEWSIDGGAWTSTAGELSFAGTGTLGAHTVRVRAVLESGYSGVRVSDEFLTGLAPFNSVEPYLNSGVAFSVDPGDTITIHLGSFSDLPEGAYGGFHVRVLADGELVEAITVNNPMATTVNYVVGDIPDGSSLSAGVSAFNIIGESDEVLTSNSAVIGGEELTFALVQQNHIFAGDATSASIPLSQPIAAGNLVVVMAQFSGWPVDITSEGGFTPIPATTGGGFDNAGTSCAFIAASAGQASPLVVHFSSTSGFANVWMAELSYTGSGSPQVDFAIKYNVANNGTTSLQGPDLLQSGNNSVILQTIGPKYDALTVDVTSPYKSPDGLLSVDTGQGFCLALNQASYSKPTFTISKAANFTGSVVGFSANPDPFTTVHFNDFEGGADGVDCTGSNMYAAATGWRGQSAYIMNGSSGIPMKYSSAAYMPLLNPISRLNDGSLNVAGTGSVGVAFATSSSNSYIQIFFGEGYRPNATKMIASIWLKSTLPDTDLSNMDVFSLTAQSGTGFANAKFLASFGGTRRAFQLEVAGGGGGSQIECPPHTQAVRVELEYHETGSHFLRLYDETMTLIGEIEEAHTGTGMPVNLVIGQTASNIPTPGYFVYFDSLAIDPNGTAGPIG